MTDQKLNSAAIEDYRNVFKQAQQSIGEYGFEGNDTASRLARTISRRIEEMLLDEMDCLRALVAEQEAADAKLNG
jgi:hypothetical protein